MLSYIYIFIAFYSINYFIKLKENVRDGISRLSCQKVIKCSAALAVYVSVNSSQAQALDS